MRLFLASSLIAISSCLYCLSFAWAGRIATVSTTRDLLDAIRDEFVNTIELSNTLVLDGSIWNSSAGRLANITRSLTLTAEPRHLSTNTYVLLDFNNLDSLFTVTPGNSLRFVGLEIRNHLGCHGTIFKPLRQSIGATLEFRSSVLHHRAGFPAEAAVISLLATHRPSGLGPGPTQLCFVQHNLSYKTTGSTAPVLIKQAVRLEDFAALVAADSSLAFQGHQYGGYTHLFVQSYDVVDSIVPQSCLEQTSGDQCLYMLLEQLDHRVNSTSPTASHWPQLAIACGVASAVVLVVTTIVTTVIVVRCRHRRRCRCSCHQRAFPQNSKPTCSGSKTGSGSGASKDRDADAAAGNGGTAINATDLNGGGLAGDGGTRSGSCLDEQERLQHHRRQHDAGDDDVEAPPQPTYSYGSSSVLMVQRDRHLLQQAGGGPVAQLTTATAAAAANAAVAMTISLSRSAAGGATDAAGPIGDSAGKRSNENDGGSCMFLGLENGQALPDWSASVIEQDVTTTSRRRGIISGGTGNASLANSSFLHLSTHRCHDDASRSGGSNVEFRMAPGGTTNEEKVWQLDTCTLNSHRVCGTSGGAVCGGGGSQQNSWYGNGGGRQPMFDSTELEPPSSISEGARDSMLDVSTGKNVAAAYHSAGGLAALAATLNELDGSSRRGVASEIGSTSNNSRRPHGIGSPQLQLEAVLGCGSWGTVYRGTWQGLLVAVKTLVFSAAADDDGRRRALREATLSASVSHPNIIAIYSAEVEALPGGQWSCRAVGSPVTAVAALGAGAGGAGRRILAGQSSMPRAGSSGSSRLGRRRVSASGAEDSDGGGAAIMDWRLYIIQEYADAGPLSCLYGNADVWPTPGAPDMTSVVALALGIARALSYLHSKRIIHGDLNPNNVLLKRDPREPSGLAVKVGDFGLSFMLPQNRSHLSNLRMGTMFYVCPAVVMKAQVGPPSDVFSLGVMLWELYHGQPAGHNTDQGPRYSSIFPAFPPTCPEAYRAVALHCLQRQPQNRPSAAQVESQLEKLMAEVMTASPPPAFCGSSTSLSSQQPLQPFFRPSAAELTEKLEQMEASFSQAAVTRAQMFMASVTAFPASRTDSPVATPSAAAASVAMLGPAEINSTE